MKIGEVAEATGVTVRSLRYYETRGLVQSERTAGGQRVFAPEAVDRVLLIQQLFAAGLSSEDIAQLLPCMTSGKTTPEMITHLEREKDRIDAQIESLGAARARLDGVLKDARDRLVVR